MFKNWYPLFGEREDGKYQIWWLEQEQDKYRTHSGIYDVFTQSPVSTSLVTSEWKVAEPTNVGRSNERNGIAQAEFEITALYKKKQESGYVKKIGEQKMLVGKIDPMLADKFDLKKHSNLKNVWSQPKLDGARCIINKEGMWTRNWKPYVSAPHIFEYLQTFFQADPHLILDGELYAHEFKDNFNEIMSLAKKTKPTIEDLELSKKHLRFWIFDKIDSHKTFEVRWKELLDLNFEDPVEYTATSLCENNEMLDVMYQEYLEDGFEGQMIRFDTVYEFKRSKNLLKRKEFIDEEFKILDIISPESGNWMGTGKRIKMITKEGVEFFGTLKGTYEYAQDVLTNRQKYINGMATVRYQNMTPDGIPRFPVVVQLYIGNRNI